MEEKKYKYRYDVYFGLFNEGISEDKVYCCTYGGASITIVLDYETIRCTLFSKTRKNKDDLFGEYYSILYSNALFLFLLKTRKLIKGCKYVESNFKNNTCSSCDVDVNLDTIVSFYTILDDILYDNSTTSLEKHLIGFKVDEELLDYQCNHLTIKSSKHLESMIVNYLLSKCSATKIDAFIHAWSAFNAYYMFNYSGKFERQSLLHVYDVVYNCFKDYDNINAVDFKLNYFISYSNNDGKYTHLIENLKVVKDAKINNLVIKSLKGKIDEAKRRLDKNDKLTDEERKIKLKEFRDLRNKINQKISEIKNIECDPNRNGNMIAMLVVFAAYKTRCNYVHGDDSLRFFTIGDRSKESNLELMTDYLLQFVEYVVNNKLYV